MEEGVCASTSSNKLFVEALKNTKDPIENAGRTEIFSVAVCTIAFFVECACWAQFCKIEWGACAPGWLGWLEVGLGRRGWEWEVRHDTLQAESREYDRVCFRMLLMLSTIIIWLDYTVQLW